MAFELFPKENRIERDLVCWDLRDPQPVEKSLARCSEFLDERVVGGGSSSTLRVQVCDDFLSRRNISMSPPGRIIVKSTFPPTRPMTVSSSLHSVMPFMRQNSRNVL